MKKQMSISAVHKIPADLKKAINFSKEVKARRIEEFNADEYSAMKNSVRDCIKFLRVGERLYKEKRWGINLKNILQ